MIFLVIIGLKSPPTYFYFILLFNKMVLFTYILVLSSFFFVIIVLSTLGLSSACYEVVLFVVLLRRFIFVGAIQTGKVDLINLIY